MLIKPNWPLPSSIHAYCTTRLGGVSQPPYETFNLGMHVGEPYDITLKNRDILKQKLSLTHEPCWLEQVHSTKVVDLSQHQKNIEADASFTRKKNKVCVIMTADCLPILLANKDATIVAAIHAGWRGLANGIIDETLKAINTDNTSLYAWLGPAISQQYFEVGDDVLTAFDENGYQTANTFKKAEDGKWFADVYGLARQRLNQLGITHIYGGEYCTYAQDELFYSYRRDKTTGRMASLIWLS